MQLKKLSLKARLVISVTLLLFVGIAISDVATYSALKSFLITKLDQQLNVSVAPASRSLTRAMLGQNVSQSEFAFVPLGSYGELVTTNGSSFVAAFVQKPSQAGSPPALPPINSKNNSIELNRPFNVSSTANSALQYRVIAEKNTTTGAITILAIPLTGVAATLGRLVIIEFLVSLFVLILLAALGTYIVGLGLRPLDKMAETANEISEGNLSARVETTSNQASEVARLANALNYMLSQLVTALERRGQSESKLRRFVADASHELRTPLTSIRGYAELVRQRSGLLDESETKRAMERIESESIRMGSLVEDLLLLARLDQNRPVEKLPVDLTELVNDLIQDLITVEPCRKIESHVEDDLWIIGDKNRMIQVISNLFSNLRFHTPECSPAMIYLGHLDPEQLAQFNGLELVRADDDEFKIPDIGKFEIVRFALTDFGNGIEKPSLKNVFERFYRTESSRSRGSGGTGLGLSLVASIVKAHNGSAWVASEGISKGTTFGFDLLIDVTETEGSFDI
ncbi:MAG: HAMP domain-containing protein [Acidimicrobiaceae bacterium]|nr:HAMP domain-containing protein [Acidimicrobiaceae bacterium]